MTRAPRILIAIVAVALLGAGTATAAKLIGGKDVRNGSLTGVDIKPASLGIGVLNEAAREELRGRRGPQGERGPSDAYAVRGRGRVRVRQNADNALLTRAVPAGSYTVQAKAVLLNASSAVASPNCQLLVSSGGRFASLDQVNDVPLNALGSTGDTAEVVVMGFADLPAGGTFRLRCTPGANESFSARDRVLIATRVGVLR